MVVDSSQVGTDDGIYTSKVTTSKEIEEKAKELTKDCKDEYCEVKNLLDFVTHIPYKVNTFTAHSPQRTIQLGFGDCDDKSNLLISMLHSLKKEAYFVLVPRHIFVITPLSGKRQPYKKGLWINGKKYFILESTAKGSSIGYPLKYRFDEISAVVEPFENKKITIKSLEYKY